MPEVSGQMLLATCASQEQKVRREMQLEEARMNLERMEKKVKRAEDQLLSIEVRNGSQSVRIFSMLTCIPLS